MAVTDTHPAAIGRPVLRAPRGGQALAATDTARGRPGAGVKTLFGAMAVVVAAYAISLIVRANGDTWTWLDGWGVSGFELLAGVLVLARGLTCRTRDRKYALLARDLRAARRGPLGDFVAVADGSLNGASPPTPVAGQLPVGWRFYPAGVHRGDGAHGARRASRLTAANYLDGVVAAPGDGGGAGGVRVRRHSARRRRERCRGRHQPDLPGGRPAPLRPDRPGHRPAAGGEAHALGPHRPSGPASTPRATSPRSLPGMDRHACRLRP